MLPCFDVDQVDLDPLDECALIGANQSDAPRDATSPAKSKRAISPTHRKIGNMNGYIR